MQDNTKIQKEPISVFKYMVRYQGDTKEEERYFQFKTEAEIFANKQFYAEIWKRINRTNDRQHNKVI